MDFSEHFNDPEFSDVVLHIIITEGEPAGKRSAKASRSYFVNKLALGNADFFKSLILRWTPEQQAARSLRASRASKRAKGADTSKGPSAEDTADDDGPGRMGRMELQHSVAAEELEAFELLLRLMYGAGLPEAAAGDAMLLVKAYAAADMYGVPRCAAVLAAALCSLSAEVLDLDLLLALYSLPEGRAHLAPLMAKGQQRMLDLLRGNEEQGEVLAAALCRRSAEVLDLDLLLALYSLPEGRVHLAPLMAKCQQRLVQLFGDVPSVITSDQLWQQFCSLPFAAVLAWLKADDLKVHSENCVVFLLSMWVASEDHAACPAAQLEELACHVRVLHLSPLYLQYVLPSLAWFSSQAKHLPGLVLQRLSGTNAIQVIWKGPPAWQAGPRTGTGLPSLTLDWEIGGAQLKALYDGDDVRSEPLYVNGVYLRLKAAPRKVAAGAQLERLTLGLFLEPMCHMMHLVLSRTACAEATAMFECTMQFKVPTTGDWKGWPIHHIQELATGLGFLNLLDCSGSTLKEVVSSFLVEGKLLVRATDLRLG